MKSFIFTLAMVSCILLSQGLSLESTRTTMLTTLAATTSYETSSAAPALASASPVEVVHPFAKAITATATKAPGQECKEIGSACSISDECCSRRCTSYRRRCAY